MSVAGGVRERCGTPPLPRSIWLVAWASLADQTVLLLSQGIRSDDELSLAGSVVLGALLVGYVSAGVVRARTVRVVIAWVVLILAAIVGLLGLISADDAARSVLALVSLATTLVALAGLAIFRRSDWYVWQRTRPPTREGSRIGLLVAIGVLVGVMGGLVNPVDDGLRVRVNVGDHGPLTSRPDPTVAAAGRLLREVRVGVGGAPERDVPVAAGADPQL